MIEDANREVGKMLCSRYGCGVTSAVLTDMGGMCVAHSSPLLFPIQQPREISREPWFIPWEFIAAHNAQALKNHGSQTLARLAERGGLSLGETLAVIENREQPWHAPTPSEREYMTARLRDLISEWQRS